VQIPFTGDNRKREDLIAVKKILEAQDKKVYVVPYGGSNLLGACGFVDAVKELKVQSFDMYLKMDYIFFASSSGGTQAGLKLGVDLFGLDIKIIPISIISLKEFLHYDLGILFIVSSVGHGSLNTMCCKSN
jgi:D-cysteine desulfhydrase